jgi:hypothetical protein
MGLFNNQSNNAIDAWLQTVTMAELDQMEKQGLDVADYKARVAARDGAGGEDAEAEGEKFNNPVDLSRLDAHIRVPRDVDGDFVRTVAGKLPLFGKDKKLQKVANGALIYTAVVQANNALWQPGAEDYLPAVLVFALDEPHCRNVNWLNEIAGRIRELKNASDVPQDCSRLIASLRDDQSDFCWKVGSSVSGGADAWCAVYKFSEQTVLPRQCLPSEGIVPFILREGPEENVGVWFYDIPGKMYVIES